MAVKITPPYNSFLRSTKPSASRCERGTFGKLPADVHLKAPGFAEMVPLEREWPIGAIHKELFLDP